MTEQATVVTSERPAAANVSFAEYGKTFQEKVLQALLVDKLYAQQMMEFFNVDYFELKYLQFLSDRYFTFAKKYHEFPTLQLLITIVKDDLKGDIDISLRDQVIDYLQRMKTNPDPGDLPFIKEKSLDFCKKQALKEALEKTIDLVATEKYDSIVGIIKTAVAVGQVPSVGHDFMKDMDARFVTTKRACVPTGYQELDRKEIFNGGLGQGELGVVTATTGVGKSHFLVSLGSAAILAGKNVVHYTLELSETNVGLRYDSHICDIPSNEVVENKEHVKKTYETSEGMGRLIIKNYPANTCSIFTIRSHIERLQLKGFSPDLIIVDYADIMRSTREYDALRLELKLIYEELRSYADEMQIPIWTASQANRDASQSDIISAESMSESYGKAMTADVIVTISRKVAEKASGWGRLYLAKNRAGRDGQCFTIKIDTARSKFHIMGDATTPEDAQKENEVDAKRALRNHMKELERDKNLVVKRIEQESSKVESVV